MTAGSARRYPGAAPFQGDALSHKLFYGRTRESRQLTDLITAETLVVLYARSGVGKSSLLNAGVKDALWQRGFFPMLLRVNGALGPLDSLRGGIDTAIQSAHDEKRQGFESFPGHPPSLLSYFSTSQFWRGDLLLTPVLIIDQFEELFTGQSPELRDEFIKQLAELVRSIETVTAPVRVVLSLREDCLAFVEDLAADLPLILRNRYRLEPLNEAAVKEAVLAPARFNEEPFASQLSARPFTVADDAVKGIWQFLSAPSGRVSRAKPSAEPFQLALICQRVEDLAIERQAKVDGTVEVSWADLGKDAGLGSTLADFYERKVNELDPSNRDKVRRLCEDGLVTRHGRRTSLHEEAIEQRFKVDRATLAQLADRRLLRADTRLGEAFYELSHDTLAKPVVAARDAREASRQRALGVFSLLAVSALILVLLSVAWDVYQMNQLQRSLAAQAEWVRIAPTPTGGVELGGCDAREANCAGDVPVHQFVSNAAFELMATEVTNDMFDTFVSRLAANRVAQLWTPIELQTVMSRRTAVDGKFSPASRPAVNVTWFDANAFCTFVGGRLPSGDEWEYAARAGHTERLVYPWGQDYQPGFANLDENDEFTETAPVKSFKPSGGLFDMSGNVFEWTAGDNDTTGETRVAKGGSWANKRGEATVTSVSAQKPWFDETYIGFRCAR